jgi:hypothetical protein
MRYSATLLINVCDRLEGKELNNFGKLNDLLHRILKMDYALMDTKLKCRLRQDIRNMMVIENGRLIYKEF